MATTGEGPRPPHRVLPSAAATKSYSVVREPLTLPLPL